jgi:KaiC/GvpD/RAD55 family RecA-like ATPase
MAGTEWNLPQTSTGISGLDTILHGGLPKDRVYLVEGDPGTGKTTLAMQFALHGVRSGGRALYVTLSETKGELLAMARSHGWDLEGLEIFELIPIEANLGAQSQYTFFHPEEVELGETVNTILERVREVDPTHLVIDSLAELRLLAQDPRRYRRQVLAFKHYFAGKPTTALLLDDKTSLDSEKQLYSIVHGVLSLERLPRSATLIVGGAGCGKTTLAMMYASAAARNAERGAMFLFDEGVGTLLARSEGLDLGVRDCVETGCLSMHQVDPAEMSPGEFAWRVRESVEKDGATFIVIDSLNGYLAAMPQEQFLTLQMHELLTYLNQRGVVTILILAQHGMVGQQSTTAVDLSYLADSVVMLRFFEAQGDLRRAISVMKKRSTGHETSIRELQIGPPEGVRIGPPLSHFRGILTGVPEYTGTMGGLFDSGAPQSNNESPA